MPRHSSWSLSLMSLYQIFVCISLLSHVCYLSHPSYLFDLTILIILSEEYKVWSSSFCPSVTSNPLDPSTLLSTLFWHTLIVCSSFNVRDLVSHQYRTTDSITVPYIRWQTGRQNSELNDGKHPRTESALGASEWRPAGLWLCLQTWPLGSSEEA
jgi:hypothetical protein